MTRPTSCMPDCRPVERCEKELPAREKERDKNSRSVSKLLVRCRVSLASFKRMIICTPIMVRIIEITKMAVNNRIWGRSMVFIIVEPNLKCKDQSAKLKSFCYIADMAKESKKEQQKITQAVVEKMVSLSTAGFGLVAALAWNNVIKDLVDNYVQPLIGGTSGIWSLLIYAVVVTVMAVVVTVYLSRLAARLK